MRSQEIELGDSRVSHSPDAFTGSSGFPYVDRYTNVTILGEFPVEQGPTVVFRQGHDGVELAWETPMSADNFLLSLKSLKFAEGEDPDMVIINAMGLHPIPFNLSELDEELAGISRFEPYMQAMLKPKDIYVYTTAEELKMEQEETENGTRNIASIERTLPQVDISFAAFYTHTTGVSLPEQVIAQIEASPLMQTKGWK